MTEAELLNEGAALHEQGNCGDDARNRVEDLPSHKPDNQDKINEGFIPMKRGVHVPARL